MQGDELSRGDLVDARSPGDVLDLLRRMPKAELHLHLDGSLRPATALELARDRGIARDLDLDGFRGRLTAPPRCADQAELLRAFDLPISLMQDREALERTAFELVEDVRGDGTRYVEIRWAPLLHTARGLGVRDGIDAVVAGAMRGGRQLGVVVRLIAVALRSHDPEANARMAREAVRFAGSGLTGFDCAGPEAAFPDPLRHAAAFAIAHSGGLGITCHAGEWGGPAQVRRALQLGPSRIAHGSPAIDDRGLQAELIDRGITLDLCPTSNVQSGIVRDVASHPLAKLYRAGVPVTLSTDDRTVSDLTLVREYARAHVALDLSPADLWAIDRHALDVAFLHDDEETRARLSDEFDAFALSEGAVLA